MDHQNYLLTYYQGLAQKLISGDISAEQFAGELTQIHLAMEKRVYQDGLAAGFLNNLGFTNFLERELRVIKRIPQLAGVLLALDIDHLKQFNDTLGHIAGDKLIQLYAKVMARHIRESDLKGRLGGDEFAVFLIGSNLENAKVVAERIRADIIEEVKKNFPQLPWEQTISIGIAQVKADDTAEPLRLRADDALYEAKKEKNKVVVAGN
ncbi:MAG: Diguanylate cyclase [Candidatus Daviesbacteria bacterium GW2011_GWA2_42_7]|uniref:Diguanylate cyclase n=1 Tax=Candidatus Daviesbacteria bacterium GW2011_GWA2_42_7 TaxID=1618425 RepID=A0A0G1B9Q2_9BACT|nr:MAG: Diguanylate cyclase [Candidatus Daviesbacteria bacterium GW2011_GWA2_42_7]